MLVAATDEIAAQAYVEGKFDHLPGMQVIEIVLATDEEIAAVVSNKEEKVLN